jgi:hypothetical protein
MQMMVMMPLFFFAHAVFVVLLFRKMSRIEKALGDRSGGQT